MSDAPVPAQIAAALLAVDPQGLGGAVLRGLPGLGRDAFLSAVRDALPDESPWRRLPLSISDSRLLGGLDLAATLRAGRPVAERGLLAEADGGFVLAAMAERLTPLTTAQLCAALDRGLVVAAREGIGVEHAANIAVIALDEGVEEGETAPATLRDRLAFVVETERLAPIAAAAPDDILRARLLLPKVGIPDDAVSALVATAQVLGIDSLRAPLLAIRAARAMAALEGRELVCEADISLAAALVLAPRATRIPQSEQDESEADPPPPEPPAEPETPPESAEPQTEVEQGQMEDRVLDAAKAAIPPGLLAMLQAAALRQPRARTGGKAGAWQKSGKRGRPGGTRRGAPGPNARLNLIETLRSAAPWQGLRRAESPSAAAVLVRPEDFMVTRFRQRQERTTIFVVDASGSLAANRLAEAKGAVELLLAECYVRRDQVAMIAFRGHGSELLLPPTRSLVRAKRALRQLPGGGGTPLAAGIAASAVLAEQIARKGGTPAIVLLTDGSANIARDTSPGRTQAGRDALEEGQALRRAGRAALLVDTSQRPAAAARNLADAMGAVYLPMPYADANGLSRAVLSVLPKD